MNGYKKLEQELIFMYDIIVELAFSKAENIKEENVPDNMKSIFKSFIELKKVFDLKYISHNKEDFESNLLYYTGLTKEDIIKNIIFELYANEIYKDAKLSTNKYLTETQFLKEYIEPKVRKDCIKRGINIEIEIKKIITETISDKKRYNAKYYCSRYLNNFDNNTPDKYTDPFWQKVTHYSNLFGDINDINVNSSKLNKCKNNTFPDFQIPFYSFIACNYTAKNTLLTHFLNGNFNKINFKNIGKRDYNSFIDLIEELVSICSENEKYKNISYYMIEKEFNPIIIEMLVNIFLRYSLKEVSPKTISTVLYRLNFISTMNPMVFSNDKIFDVLANSHIEKEDERRGLPCTVEIRNVRFINEFYNMFSSIANSMFKDIMKDLISNDEEAFLSIYNKKGDSILSSIENLKGYIDNFPEIENILKDIMKLKANINNSISEVNKKMKEITNFNAGEDLNKLDDDLIYLREDVNDLVHYDDMLRLLFKIPKTI